MGGNRCRYREISSAGWMAPALWLLQMATIPLFSSSPREASLGSACSNHVNLLVTSLSFWINCGPNPGDSLSYKKKKKSFLFWLPGVRVWWVDFFFHLIFHHCTLQLLLVCIRIAEFVCTLINMLLKCFDVLISWFLGNPSTKEASWVEGCWLFIVLFLLVGIDPRLPAQGQCALSSINPCGLKDLKREGKKLRRVHDCSLWTQTNFPVSFLLSLSQQHLMRGKVVKRLVQLGGRRDVKVKVAGWEVLGSIHFRAKVHFWPIVFSIERLNFPEMFCKFRWTRPDSAPSF